MQLWEGPVSHRFQDLTLHPGQGHMSQSRLVAVCTSASDSWLPHPPCLLGPGFTTADVAFQVPGHLDKQCRAPL